MARKHLSGRENWQADGLKRATKAENNFSDIMDNYLSSSEFKVQSHPRCLTKIYQEKWGIVPEYKIQNLNTKKSIFVEVKRQKGGGNAHERACRYFMPALVESCRIIANQPAGVIPFWIIFSDGITQNKKGRAEIQHWFTGYERHLLLWDDYANTQMVKDHFDTHIRNMLE